ncbi:MAG: GerMN domain-containing protein [Dictyoglomi bacterium]|nr:GerMN domain-containing protein [Dictyoglomota bacterium]
MWRRMSVLLVLLISISLVLVGCSWGTSSTTGTSTTTPVSQGTDVQMTAYVIADGGTYFYLKPVKVKVHFDSTPTLEDKLKMALSLLASPTIATATTQVPLPEGTKVLDVKVTGSVATVNFSKEIMKNPGVGAEGEALALCSIPLTAKQFGIEKVYVLIEGQKPSGANGYIDFWGHVGLYEQPLTAQGCQDTP